MCKLAGEAWSQYWGRDDPDSSLSDWDEACSFITQLEDCSSCEYEDFTEDSWREMLKGVNPRSARGSCGFSVEDLRIKRGPLLQWLFTLFRTAEAGDGWPSRLLQARVTLLAKTSEAPSDPLDTRPITVLSRLYRVGHASAHRASSFHSWGHGWIRC